LAKTDGNDVILLETRFFFAENPGETNKLLLEIGRMALTLQLGLF
jgi:hypothetical protein